MPRIAGSPIRLFIYINGDTRISEFFYLFFTADIFPNYMHVSCRNRHMIRLNQDKLSEIEIDNKHEIYSRFLDKMKIKDGKQ